MRPETPTAYPPPLIWRADAAGWGPVPRPRILHSHSYIEITRPEILKMPRDIRTGGKTHQRNSIPAVKMTTGHHFRVVEDVHSQGLERGLMAPPALQSRWSPSPGPDLANVRVAENNRRIPIAERLSANAAHHFSFLRNCLRSAPEPLVYVNPCGPEALALISDQRGATNNPRRSAESESRSSARAGRDWPVMPTTRTEPSETLRRESCEVYVRSFVCQFSRSVSGFGVALTRSKSRKRRPLSVTATAGRKRSGEYNGSEETAEFHKRDDSDSDCIFRGAVARGG